MNNTRRKELQKSIDKLNNISAALAEVNEDIQYIMDEEQDCFDNLTEGLQCTARGEAMQDAVDSLQDAINSLEEIDIEEVISSIEDAINV